MPKLLCCVLSAGMLCAPVFAQSMDDMPGMAPHHHHDDADQVLGKVSFPVSCSAASQKTMEHGVALLHSFGYTEAQMTFQGLTTRDPKCAMAHWGVAMTQFQELWGQPGKDGLKLGTEEIGKARAEAAAGKVTPREQAYIDAMSAFFAPGDVAFTQRAKSYEAKMDALHAAFPGDVEGAAFDALAILASEDPDDTSLTHERRALAILVPLFHQHPDHPGLAHYIIHTCDTPALAQDGLSAAQEYAKIAPSSAHALHMPGHIFARLGMWQEDIDSNVASVAASKKAEAEHEPGAAHQMHADEFLIYAYLQTGQDEKARAQLEQMRGIGETMAAMPGMDDMKMGGAYFDNELHAVYLLEMHDWKAAKELKKVPSKNGGDHNVVWANGVGAGHLGDKKATKKALDAMEKIIEEAKKRGAMFALPGLQIKRDELAGWAAYAAKKPDEAVASMRKAADQQDKLGQGEVDIPAREMLGDILLLLNKPADALREYKIALVLSPNRLNGLLSAGAAAEAGGDMALAKSYYKAAAKQTEDGKFCQRPELAHAVKVAESGVVSGQ